MLDIFNATVIFLNDSFMRHSRSRLMHLKLKEIVCLWVLISWIGGQFSFLDKKVNGNDELSNLDVHVSTITSSLLTEQSVSY